MKSVYIILSAACFTFYLASCTKDQAKEASTDVDTSCTHNKTDTMSYINDIVPIMTTNCTDPSLGDCHYSTSSLGFDYTSYDLLSAYLPDIFIAYVLDPSTATMPRSNTNGPTQLTNCEKEKLQLWIDQGYPNN